MDDVKKFFWDVSYLYRTWADGIIRRFVPEVEMFSILGMCHSSHVGGNHSDIRSAQDFVVHELLAYHPPRCL